MFLFTKALLTTTFLTAIAGAQTAPAPANPTVPAATTSNANTNVGVGNSSAFGTVNNGANVQQPATNPNTSTNTAPTNTSSIRNTGTSNLGTSQNPPIGTTTTQGATSKTSSGNSTIGASATTNRMTMNSDQIRAAQTQLTSSGYAVGVDGVLGNKTADSIRTFQRDRGLTQTGVFDQQTMDALNGKSQDDDRAPSSVNESPR